jgi:hypothetical protein
MDKKFKRYKVDYAAAYRHYIDFGGGRTLEKFCQDEGYDFEKFKRYGRDAFWQHLIYKDDSEFEKQKEAIMSTGGAAPPEQNVIADQSGPVLPLKTINFFKVEFSDGLSLSMSNVSVERMFDLLQSVGK